MFRLAALLAALGGLALFTTPAWADEDDQLFDFNDAYYTRNGVNPTKIINRVDGTAPRSAFGTPFFPSQRGVRALRLNPAYADDGDYTFWTVMGDLDGTGFTNDAAGKKAKQTADKYVLYVFPRHDQTNLVTLGANRQADLVDLSGGYFSNNPLGLWLHTWVQYTPKGLTTTAGKKALADLQKRNGLAVDGTPIIRTKDELDNLLDNGYAAKRLRKADGSEGPMYGICPVIKDPRRGGVGPDTTLTYVRKADGSPLEPEFLRQFISLQDTGEWADN